MKRWLALLLALLLLPLSGALCRAEETSAAEDRPYRYSGKMRLSARVYAGWSMTKGVDQIGTIPQKAYVQIHAYTPDFAYVTYPQGNVTGYVKRVCIQDIKVRGQQNFIGFFRHAPGENAHGNEIGKAVAHRFNQQIRLVFIAAADIRPADCAPGRELTDFAVGFKRIQLGIRKGRIEAVERADRRDLVAR